MSNYYVYIKDGKVQEVRDFQHTETDAAIFDQEIIHETSNKFLRLELVNGAIVEVPNLIIERQSIDESTIFAVLEE